MSNLQLSYVTVHGYIIKLYDNASVSCFISISLTTSASLSFKFIRNCYYSYQKERAKTALPLIY